MRKVTVIILALILFGLGTASAHEHSVFEIGDNFYMFTVGSVNEPVVVDDKTGVELKIVKLVSRADHGGAAVTGLQDALKVELQAGDKKKTLALQPVFNSPGSYRAVFIPTVQTTYTYRVFGVLDGQNIDLSFVCGGESEESATGAGPYSGAVLIKKEGSFGCPLDRGTIGFPEPALASFSLASDFGELEAQAASAKMISIVSALLALSALGIVFFAKKKR